MACSSHSKNSRCSRHLDFGFIWNGSTVVQYLLQYQVLCRIDTTLDQTGIPKSVSPMRSVVFRLLSQPVKLQNRKCTRSQKLWGLSYHPTGGYQHLAVDTI